MLNIYKMSGIYSMKVEDKLPTAKHYIQLLQYISDHIELEFSIKEMLSIKEIQLIICGINIPESILLELIGQMSKYRFYIENTNEYCNKLSLLQFFECIEKPPNFVYVYNIFYDCNCECDYIPIDIQYIRCFGKKLKTGINNMDFRLLPLQHFNTLLKILQNDYVANSRTFAKHEIEYIQEYQKYKYERDNYVYVNNSKIQLCKSLINHHFTIMKLKNKHLELKNINLELKNKHLELKNINLQKKYDMLECLISML
jgi:hypothetical protein